MGLNGATDDHEVRVRKEPFQTIRAVRTTAHLHVFGEGAARPAPELCPQTDREVDGEDAMGEALPGHGIDVAIEILAALRPAAFVTEVHAHGDAGQVSNTEGHRTLSFVSTNIPSPQAPPAWSCQD